MPPTPDRPLCSGLVAPRPDAAQPAAAQPAEARPDTAPARATPRRCPIRAHCLWYTLPPRGPGDRPLPGPYDPAERACEAFEPG